MQNAPSHKTGRTPVIAPQSPQPRIEYARPAIPRQLFREPVYLEVSVPVAADGAGILSADERDDDFDPDPQ